MRPTRIEIEGFSSFRDKVEVDFADADLFVLSGPTGSGKSSVIDAMTFALYGAVPRHGKQATSAIVSKGKNLARVRLDFMLDGVEYTAVRAAKVLATGNATVNEARLECGDSVLADGSNDLTATIEELVGLSFDHFTQCVVLPQGAFQEFLQAKPAKRQDMLVELLDLGIYEQIRSAAVERARAAGVEGDTLEMLLGEQYSDASAEAIEDAEARSEEVAALAKTLKERRQDLENRQRAAREAAEAVETVTGRIERLANLVPPDGLQQLTEQLAKAEAAVEVAQESSVKSESDFQAATDRKEALGEKAARMALLQQFTKLAEREALMPERETRLAQAETAKREADGRRGELEGELDKARLRLSEAKERYAAAALAESLVVGSPCPVCLRNVDEVPDHDADDDFGAMEAEVARLDDEHRKALTGVQDAIAAWAASERARDGALSELDAIRAELKEATEPAQLKQEIDAIEAAQAVWLAAKKSRKQAMEEVEATKKRLRALGKAEGSSWKAFDDARDSVGELKPPKRQENDLGSSWEVLAQWAAAEALSLREQVVVALRRQEETEASEEEMRKRIESQLTNAGIGFREGQDPFDVVDAAKAEAAAEVRRLQKAYEEAKNKRSQLVKARARQSTAEELARLLKANQFEKWLLGRALRQLTRSATTILHELTSGAYSLTVSGKNEFAVVDHLNADEVRSAATLSGGETFLASLSLALALAEQVSQLSARGSSKLEALFLDEGFGTLDAETLDVVATTLEELGAQGRMIGVITHVRELADRLPVRYDLRKEGNVSSITRVA